MAGKVIGEVWEQCAKCRAADRPTVDEQHVRPGSDATIGDLPSLYVKESFGLVAEEFGGS